MAGRLTHRFGPRFTVVTAQLVQGMGVVAYLVAALWLPPGWLVPYAFAAWLLFVVANKVIYPVAGALSDALPPRNARAGYMATFQYSFTTAQVVAPAVVALFAFSPWAPWAVVASAALAAMVTFQGLGRSIPVELNRTEVMAPTG